MAESSGDRLDVIVFGATGYTGKVVVEKIFHLAKEKGNVTWAIAGRSKSKLESVLDELKTKTGKDVSGIKIILADVADPASLKQMAEQGRVVINCVGPYRFYGEAMVKACIEAGTHHVDVSGEPQYMERMQLDHHKTAEEKGVYVVSACGFDSVPADIGTIYLANKFEGDLNTVESYLEFWSDGSMSGPALHYTTWESAIYGVSHVNELRPLRSKLFPNKMPVLKPKLKHRSVHKRPPVKGFCIPFLGSDRSVMIRSQRYFHEMEKKRPIQVQAYVAMKSLLALFLVAIIGSMLFVLSRFQWGCRLLLNHPKFFSFGMVTHEGPTEESRKKSRFSCTLFGEGWTEKLAEPTDEHASEPNKTMTVKLSGEDPGYTFTATSVTLAALMCLRESDKMPSSGGVYPPGAAFAKTSFIEELEKHALKFEILETVVNTDLLEEVELQSKL